MEWHERNCSKWTPRYAKQMLERLKNDIFPIIGKTPIADIKAQDVLQTLRKIEKRERYETAHRLANVCSRVFRYAVLSGVIDINPLPDLRGVLTSVPKKHLAAVTEPKDVARVLRMIDAYDGSLVVKSALRLAPLVFVRPGELRAARWEDISLESKEWRYLVTKTDTQHIVPLSHQAIEILQEIKQATGGGPFVFPSYRSIKRPMSDGALLVAMRSMGISKEEMTPHGFRAMARTLLAERLKYPAEYIEHQLAHAVHGPLGRAYNRTTHLDARRKMMESYSNYLDELKENGAGE